MPEIHAVPLGAGQDVGRSCILVSIAGRNVMFDCGMHMGYQDERRFPDFSYVNRSGGPLDEYISCVVISHFHLDHVGALPYMSEQVGFSGPIYMTHPTKAIVPVLLEDYRKIQTEYRGDKNFYTSNDIKNCMKKVIPVNLHETVQVDGALSLRPFYAGHVLGAAIFELRCGTESVIYTGDFNTTPDRHLGCAQVPRGLEPDLLITESTYASTIRDSKRLREKDFVEKIHECVVHRQGKVLIPVFALGRAQELCILLESYWERTGLTVPIYMSRGLAERANAYYKLFISWTNEKIKKTFVQRNMFHFAHIRPFDPAMAEMPGPCVIFATPGMLHSGQSLRVFKMLAPDVKNMIIMPGYCVQGTVGHKVINGAKSVELDGWKIPVNLSVEYMSFSAHADAHGILQLVHDTRPKHVMFVHGERGKMAFLKEKVEQDCHVRVFMPENGESISIPTSLHVQVHLPNEMLQHSLAAKPMPLLYKSAPLDAFVIGDRGQPHGLRICSRAEAAHLAGSQLHSLTFEAVVYVAANESPKEGDHLQTIFNQLLEFLCERCGVLERSTSTVPYDCSTDGGQNDASGAQLLMVPQALYGGSVQLQVRPVDKNQDGNGRTGQSEVAQVCLTWNTEEDSLAETILDHLKGFKADLS